MGIGDVAGCASSHRWSGRSRAGRSRRCSREGTPRVLEWSFCTPDRWRLSRTKRPPGPTRKVHAGRGYTPSRGSRVDRPEAVEGGSAAADRASVPRKRARCIVLEGRCPWMRASCIGTGAIGVVGADSAAGTEEIGVPERGVWPPGAGPFGAGVRDIRWWRQRTCIAGEDPRGGSQRRPWRRQRRAPGRQRR